MSAISAVLSVICARNIAAPHLACPLPNVSLPAAGLKMVRNASHQSVYAPSLPSCTNTSSPSCMGTYNHGPLLTRANETLLVNWHNGAYDEDAPGGRVLASASADGGYQWTEPVVLFQALSPTVPENTSTKTNLSGTIVYNSGGFLHFGSRLYSLSGVYNNFCSASCRSSGPAVDHDHCCRKCLGCCSCAVRTRFPLLMRRIYLQNNETVGLTTGPAFWLAKSKTLHSYSFTPAERLIPGFDDSSFVDMQATLDAREYMERLLSARVPDPPPPAAMSERSLYVQAVQGTGQAAPRRGGGKRWHRHAKNSSTGVTGMTDTNVPRTPQHLSLVMLLRDDGSPSSLRLWSSLCALTVNATTAEVQQMVAATANGQQSFLLPRPRPAHSQHLSAYQAHQICNWSIPSQTNIPDSRSATYAGVLPSGQRFLLGSQLPRKWDRDPLTLALSADGVAFSKLLAVRAGAPPKRYKGVGKGPGFQYPSAVLGGSGDLVIAYSVNKEDIGVSVLPQAMLAGLA
jgi:hypothetical protein